MYPLYDIQYALLEKYNCFLGFINQAYIDWIKRRKHIKNGDLILELIAMNYSYAYIKRCEAGCYSLLYAT